MFFDVATKSMTGFGYPFCEQNCPGEAPLFTAHYRVTKPHCDFGKLRIPHAAGPRARRICVSAEKDKERAVCVCVCYYSIANLSAESLELSRLIS